LREASAAEVAEWKSALVWLVRKLSFKHGRPLVLKSPGHTCRIRLLLELFPDAKFVHIHRNPYDVFRSCHNMVRRLTPWWTLQRPNYGDVGGATLQQYREVYDVFFEERELIPKAHYHEVAFETLEADPVGQLQALYKALDLPEFGQVEAAMRRYVAAGAEYKKNTFGELPADLRSQVAKEWRRCFDEWRYPV
jgi:hypothetical protein